MIKMIRPICLRVPTNNGSIIAVRAHIDNTRIILQIQDTQGDWQFDLTQDTARAIAATLTRAAELHATIKKIWDFLEEDCTNPA